MLSNKNSSIKKEIFLPSIIGDWTTYTAEKNKASISITKSIGNSNKTVSENTIEQLLFFHQEFFDSFFEQVIENIDSHIVIDTVSINVLNHTMFKESQKTDMFISKFHHDELEQIDFILSKKATKFISHRLCGGSNIPETNDPSDIEISIMSLISNVFFQELSKKWKTIFTFNEANLSNSFGLYFFQPQQHEDETIIEISTNFKLFNHHDLTCKVIYSLETIEKLLFYMDQLNDNIHENTSLNKETLKKADVNVTSIIGTTCLTIQEIQELEIGDVVLLEDKKITDPITMFIDEDVKFNVKPVCINNNEIGVQVLNTPYYDKYVRKINLPSEGPLIKSKKPVTTVASPTENEPISEEETNPDHEEENTSMDIQENINETEVEEMSFEDTSFEEQPQEQPIEEPVIEESQYDTTNEEPVASIEEPAPDTGGDDDDFSWDDLDDE